MIQSQMPETDSVFHKLDTGQFPSFLELMSSLNEISDQNCNQDAPGLEISCPGVSQLPPFARCRNCGSSFSA